MCIFRNLFKKSKYDNSELYVDSEIEKALLERFQNKELSDLKYEYEYKKITVQLGNDTEIHISVSNFWENPFAYVVVKDAKGFDTIDLSSTFYKEKIIPFVQHVKGIAKKERERLEKERINNVVQHIKR